MGLAHAALLFALPVGVVGIGKLVWHRSGGIERGWCGALFIGLCMASALLAVLDRVS